MHIVACFCGYNGAAHKDGTIHYCPQCDRILFPIEKSGMYHHPTPIPKVFVDVINELEESVNSL